ncbi:MAG: DNA double-strand break repair nuclease NurA [Haloarculaceae archaeon]
MTLDPVHVDGIARLASRVRDGVDDRERDEVAERAWAEFLDPLYHDGEAILEPLEGVQRHKVPIDDIALESSPFETQHGLDAGTINPTTFKNGLVLDVSQAAMAAVPSDIDLHRARTIVMTVHTNDRSVDVHDPDWRLDDEGYARRRILHAPRVDRYEQTVVHALALYLAESEHAIDQAEVVEDLLVLDGPIYPTGLLKWSEHDPELRRLLTDEEQPRDVVANYLDLVETFVDRDVPLAGFVKNSASKAITRPLRSKLGAPWIDDDAFFRRVLERLDEDGEPETDALTFTNWFRSRVGTDGMLADGSLDIDCERELDEKEYEVTFFVVYDPRDDLIYRVEAPYAFTADPDLRADLTGHLLSEIAGERGPPLPVGKADELARIDREGKQTLRRRIEREFDTSQRETYDDKRWNAVEEML